MAMQDLSHILYGNAKKVQGPIEIEGAQEMLLKPSTDILEENPD